MSDDPVANGAADGRDARQRAFADIYDGHDWLGGSGSGPGSDPKRTSHYRSLVQSFLRDNHIRSVLDIGCGDWSSSRLVDWSGVTYLGVDVVDAVVDANRDRYIAPNVSFRCLDAVADELPAADLVLVKEVLQHLPSSDVQRLLTKLAEFPYAIVVNDIAHRWRRRWVGADRWHPLCPTNTDVAPGGYRLLALREPPFNLAATQLSTYVNRYQGAKWVKEVLLFGSAVSRSRR